jgi:uncharacterized protein (UPF0248 family)
MSTFLLLSTYGPKYPAKRRVWVLCTITHRDEEEATPEIVEKSIEECDDYYYFLNESHYARNYGGDD